MPLAGADGHGPVEEHELLGERPVVGERPAVAAHHRHRFSLSHQVLPRRHGSAMAVEGLLKALLSEARQSTLYHHDIEYDSTG